MTWRVETVDDACVETGIVGRCCQSKAAEDRGELVVPMMRAAAESVEGLVQEPELVVGVSRITDGRANGHLLIVGEGLEGTSGESEVDD